MIDLLSNRVYCTKCSMCESCQNSAEKDRGWNAAIKKRIVQIASE